LLIVIFIGNTGTQYVTQFQGFEHDTRKAVKLILKSIICLNPGDPGQRSDGRSPAPVPVDAARLLAYCIATTEIINRTD
jgi:hypothetical protein